MSTAHIQGSEDWLELRREKIGSSDAAKVMGISPYGTALQLWREKKGLVEPEPMNRAMEIGIALESEALASYCEKTGLSLFSQVVHSDDYEWMIASFDGRSLCGRHAVEIKCSERLYKMALAGEIPDYYMAQMHHQMVCGKLDSMDYYCYWQGQGVRLSVSLNPEFADEMLAAERRFYECLITDTEPKATEKDYEDKDDCAMWRQLCNRLREIDAEISPLKAERELIREELISIAKGRSCKGAGVTLRLGSSRGSVDYKSIPELNGVDLTPYRRSPTISWTLRVS